MSEMAPIPIGELGRNSRHQRRMSYRCACGNTFEALEYNVKGGRIKSCGCTTRAAIARARLRHGESRPQSVEYRTWSGIKNRCINSSNSSYAQYGGRGIRMHPAWIESYEAFLRDVGRRPSPAHSIERKDNNGDYVPGNVCWATRRDQARNRRSNRIIEFSGKRQCLEQWATDLKICQSTLHERLQKWPIERALTKHGIRKSI